MIRLTKEAEQFQLFYQIYIEGSYQDPHSKFAECLAISRMEAKSIAYKFAYGIRNSNFMRAYD